jgi:quinol monooxygenase YgiN
MHGEDRLAFIEANLDVAAVRDMCKSRLMVKILARYKVSPGNSKKVQLLLKQLKEASRQEPGNDKYDVYFNFDDENLIIIDEIYKDQAALDAHRASPHFRDIALGQIVPLLADRTVDVRVE